MRSASRKSTARCSISASPRASSMRRSAASVSCTTGRSTCAWIRRARHRGGSREHDERRSARAHFPHARRGARRAQDRRADSCASAWCGLSRRTLQLADAVESVVPRHGRTHPATRIFQALRIAVNRELEVLRKGSRNSRRGSPRRTFRRHHVSFARRSDRENVFRSSAPRNFSTARSGPSRGRNPDYLFRKITAQTRRRQRRRAARQSALPQRQAPRRRETLAPRYVRQSSPSRQHRSARLDLHLGPSAASSSRARASATSRCKNQLMTTGTEIKALERELADLRTQDRGGALEDHASVLASGAAGAAQRRFHQAHTDHGRSTGARQHSAPRKESGDLRAVSNERTIAMSATANAGSDHVLRPGRLLHRFSPRDSSICRLRATTSSRQRLRKSTSTRRRSTRGAAHPRHPRRIARAERAGANGHRRRLADQGSASDRACCSPDRLACPEAELLASWAP